jgi:hypothetical protein
MGGEPGRADDEFIIDEMERGGRDLRLAFVDRTIVTLRRCPDSFVTWGMAPDPTVPSVSFAGGSFHVASAAAADSLSMLEWISRQRMSETLRYESDESVFVTTHHFLNEAGGVYHLLTPALHVPVSHQHGGRTKLVNAKKTRGGAIALTWLYEEELHVALRLKAVERAAFDAVKIESTLFSQGVAAQSRLSSLLDDAARLPAKPEAWRVLLDAVRSVIGPGAG